MGEVSHGLWELRAERLVSASVRKAVASPVKTDLTPTPDAIRPDAAASINRILPIVSVAVWSPQPPRADESGITRRSVCGRSGACRVRHNGQHLKGYIQFGGVARLLACFA